MSDEIVQSVAALAGSEASPAADSAPVTATESAAAPTATPTAPVAAKPPLDEGKLAGAYAKLAKAGLTPKMLSDLVSKDPERAMAWADEIKDEAPKTDPAAPQKGTEAPKDDPEDWRAFPPDMYANLPLIQQRVDQYVKHFDELQDPAISKAMKAVLTAVVADTMAMTDLRMQDFGQRRVDRSLIKTREEFSGHVKTFDERMAEIQDAGLFAARRALENQFPGLKDDAGFEKVQKVMEQLKGVYKGPWSTRRTMEAAATLAFRQHPPVDAAKAKTEIDNAATPSRPGPPNPGPQTYDDAHFEALGKTFGKSADWARKAYNNHRG